MPCVSPLKPARCRLPAPGAYQLSGAVSACHRHEPVSAAMPKTRIWPAIVCRFAGECIGRLSGPLLDRFDVRANAAGAIVGNDGQ